MPLQGHLTEHSEIYGILNNHYPSETGGMAGTYSSSPVNWGVGWVHPTSGSDSYDGSTQQTPKATIGAALSAGFRVIHVGAGNHGWTGSSGAFVLVHHPGVHTYVNAPITCTGQVGLVGLYPLPDHVGATSGGAMIRGSGSPQDIFRLDNGGAQRWGGIVRYLKFDASTFTRAAVYTNGLNTIDVDMNVINADGWRANRYLLYSTASYTATTDQSWGRITRNQCRGAALCYYKWQQGWINRLVIDANRGWAGGGTSIANPYVTIEAGNSQGHAITNNSFEGSGTDGTDNTPFIYLKGKHNQLHWSGNASEHTDTTDHVGWKLGDSAGQIVNSVILHSIGDTTSKGYIRINGTTYTTGVEISPASDTYKNHIVVAGRHSY